jgi:hypothetical protein
MTSATQINSDIQFILEHILLAPSGDNTQPWRCIVDGTTIEFWYESQTAFVPKMFWESIQGRSFSYLTFGILIEHAAIAASTRGYRVIPTYFPDATQELYIAKIEIIKDDSVVPDPLISAISERSTNRNPYEVKPLQQKDRDVLMTVSSPVPGPQLKLVESKMIWNKVCHLIRTTKNYCSQINISTNDFFHLLTGQKKQMRFVAWVFT